LLAINMPVSTFVMKTRNQAGCRTDKQHIAVEDKPRTIRYASPQAVTSADEWLST
jgi:hypothetical protein